MGESSIGRMIKKRRESLVLSQARLGELVGRSASTIRNWERDRTSPSERSDVVALAAILGMDEREALDQAGFETPQEAKHPTLEQAYASLGPHPEEVLTSDEDDPPDKPGEAVAVLDEGMASLDQEDPSPAQARSPLESELPQAPTDDSPDVAEAEQQPKEDGVAVDLVSTGSVVAPTKPSESDGEDRSSGQRVVERAAPPTVLETAPVGEPSYLEDPEERQRYRLRALVTAIAVVALVIVLVWSFDRTTNALGNMWNHFVSMLDL
jgi:transcriptional regulator with XRE-family HTH domain